MCVCIRAFVYRCILRIFVIVSMCVYTGMYISEYFSYTIILFIAT